MHGLWRRTSDRLGYCWRLVATGSSFALFGLGGLVIPALVLPVVWALGGGQGRRQRRARYLAHKTFALFILTMRLLGVLTWQASHRERLLLPGQLILANHPTLLDVVFLVSLVPDACCVVGKGLDSNPAMRGFIGMAGYITNDNGQRMLAAAEKAMRGGSSVIIFPEGTRSKPGQPLRFLRGAANIALRTRATVRPVTISCAPLSLTKGSAWHEIPDRPVRFRIRAGKRIDMAAYRQAPPAVAARRLTLDLQEHFTRELGANGNG